MAVKYYTMLIASFASNLLLLSKTRSYESFELVNLQYHFSIDRSVPLDELEKNLHLIADDGSIFVGEPAFKFIFKKYHS